MLNDIKLVLWGLFCATLTCVGFIAAISIVYYLMLWAKFYIIELYKKHRKVKEVKISEIYRVCKKVPRQED